MYNNVLQANDEFAELRTRTIDLAASIDSCYLPTLYNAWDYVGVYDTTLSIPNTELINYTYNSFYTYIDTPNTFVGYFDVLTPFSLRDTNFYIAPNTNIVIKNGGNLDLRNANLYFGENSGIIVEEGGNLHIESSTLTYGLGMDACDLNTSNINLWNGIEFNNTLGNGTLEINNTTISNSKNGLLANTPVFTFRNSKYINNLQPITAKGTANNNLMSVIRNNHFEITSDFENEQLEYQFLKLEDNLNANINSNTFLLSVTPYGLSNTNHSLTQAIYINNVNSTSYNSIDSNTFYNVKQAIDINTSKQYNISYNTFTNQAPAYLANQYSGGHQGINIYNTSNLILSNNVYKNLKKAIDIKNSMSAFITDEKFDFCKLSLDCNWNRIVRISNSEFNAPLNSDKAIRATFTNIQIDSNIINNYTKGIQIFVCKGVNINNNKISNVKYNSLEPNSGYGVFISSSEKFEIKDNEIKGLIAAIPHQSLPLISEGTRAIVVEHSMGEKNRIFRNKISYVHIAIHTQGYNKRLRLKCNTTNSSFTGLMVFDELEDQGENCELELGMQLLPGNVWNNTCNNTSPLVYRDIILSPKALTYDFNYWAHSYGINPNGGTNLRTTPDCQNLLLGNYRVCDGNNGNLEQIMETDYCVDSMLYLGWKTGIIEEDLNAVAIPQEILDLEGKKQTLVANMALVEALITDRELQKDLVAQLETIYKDIVTINATLVELYKKNNNKAAAENLLEQDNTIEAKMKLAKHYIAENETGKAQRVINEMINLSKLDESFFNQQKQLDFEQNKDHTAEILELEKNLKQSNRLLNQLNTSEIADLQYIKSLDLPIATKAEAILALNGDSLPDHHIKQISFLEYAELTSVNNTNFDYTLAASPNPASNNTNVSFTLPSDDSNYTLKLVDNYNNIGNVVYTTEVTNISSKNIDISNYTNGVYTIAIFKNDTEVASIQLLVVN